MLHLATPAHQRCVRVGSTEHVPKGKSYASKWRSQEKRPCIDHDRGNLRVCAGLASRSLAIAWFLTATKKEGTGSSSSYSDELLFLCRIAQLPSGVLVTALPLRYQHPTGKLLKLFACKGGREGGR